MLPLTDSKDYVGNKVASMGLAHQIELYYISKGITGVVAEALPRTLSNSQGDRVAVLWEVRSNLRFNVEQAKKGNYC